MKMTQTMLLFALITAFSSGANCDITRFEFDAVVSFVYSQSNLPETIKVGDVFSGFVDIDLDLVSPPTDQNSQLYFIDPAKQDWIEAEVLLGGVTLSTVGLIGTCCAVSVWDYPDEDNYDIHFAFSEDASFSFDTGLNSKHTTSLSDFVTGNSLEQKFTWVREPDNFDPPTGSLEYRGAGNDARVRISYTLKRVKVGPVSPVNLSGTIKTPDGSDICAMVLASGKFMFSCNPPGVLSLLSLSREPDGTVKRQIYADGFFPKIDILAGSSDDSVVMTRSGTCPRYNFTYDPSDVPGSAGKQIYIAGKVLAQDTQTPICAMVLANGQHMFSCDGSGSYVLKIPLDAKGQFKLQVYADGFAPTIQKFDEYKTTNNVRMARAVECK